MLFRQDGLPGLLIMILCGSPTVMDMYAMADHFQDFPFEEIRKPNGDYFDTAEDAMAAGYAESQVWSVIEGEGTYVYGPSHHYINRLGYIATKEHHDGNTYYHEKDPDYDDTDGE